MRKAQVLATLLLTLVLIICLASPAFAAEDEIVTAYYRDKVYHGTIRQCQEQALEDFGWYNGRLIYAYCDYEYLRKTQKLYNFSIKEEKWQYNYDAHGIDIPGLTPTPPNTTPTPKPTKTPAQTTSTPDPVPSKPVKTQQPTTQPTATPTTKPTVKPTTSPTTKPTVKPTTSPTTKPTVKPTASPTTKPTVKPTASPTAKPSTPAAPNSLKAISASYSSIKVSWNAVTGAGGYEVWSSTGSGYTRVATVAGTTSTSSKLTTGKSYYFKIRAYRTVSGTKIYSPYTPAVSAIPVPAVPTAPKAASASYSSVKLTWKPVAGAGGYEVWRSTGSGYTRVATVAGTTSTSSKLSTGKRYYFKIRAYRTVSGKKVYGAYTAAVSSIPVPAVPAAPKAASTSYNSIKVNWRAVAGAGGYEVWRSTGSGYTRVATVAGTTSTSSKLSTGKRYYFKIRAYRTVSGKKVYGAYTPAVSAIPVPAAPTGVKAAKASPTSVKLSWAKVAGTTKYEVYRATSSAGTYTRIAETASVSYTNTKLSSGKTFYYKVRAYRVVGKTKVYSPFSTTISYKTRR